MEIKQIKELMVAMERLGIKRLRIKDKEEYEIELERREEMTPYLPPVPSRHGENQLRFATHTVIPSSAPEQPFFEEKKNEEKFITAPLVGTVYQAPSPEDPPFVKVGDSVNEGTVVCIIEAMKVMNEVKAGVCGTIVEVLVQSEQPVEFGTKLFKIV